MPEKTFRIAIPSYKRAGTLLKKTLRFLQRQSFPVDRVDIFVASQEEREEYRKVLGNSWNLILGKPGIHRQREEIHWWYAKGDWVLCIDDDVDSIRTLYPEVPFEVLIERCFQLAEAANCRLWGVYPTDFGTQLKNRMLQGRFYILGSFFGMINYHVLPGEAGPQPILYPHQTTEDFTRSLQCYEADGAVLRFDGIGPHTQYFKEPGGLQEYRTPDRQLAEMQALVTRYPEYVELRNKFALVDCRIKREVQAEVYNPFGYGDTTLGAVRR